MNRPVALLLSSALLASATVAYAARPTPDERLARITEGRTAGKPQDCLMQRDIRSSRIIDGKAIVYETSNGTVFVNTPKSGASSLRDHYVLVTDTHSNQLCSIDVVKLYDASARMQAGFVGLGPFVPYTKVKAPQHH